MSKELTDFEREVYSFIKQRGEVLTSNLPPRMMGAVPNLKNKGLVEVIKRCTSPLGSKKRKFVKVKGRQQSTIDMYRGNCLAFNLKSI